MGVLPILGNALMSLVLSLVANIIDRYMQSRKGKEKEPPAQPK
jgi:hypothetical protein